MIIIWCTIGGFMIGAVCVYVYSVMPRDVSLSVRDLKIKELEGIISRDFQPRDKEGKWCKDDYVH